MSDMTRKIALYCMKAYSELHSEVCEECEIYGQTGCDHCFEDALQVAIASLETDEAYQLEYEQTTKDDLAVDCKINRLDDFIEYAKKTFGIELTFKKSDNPDTYEKLFGTTKSEWQQDHEILKAYSDGYEKALEDIRAEIDAECGSRQWDDYDYCSGLIQAKRIIDKHMESEDKGMPSVTPQEPKIKVLDRNEAMRKLGTVDVYTASAWITLLKDLEYLGLKICEVEE